MSICQGCRDGTDFSIPFSMAFQPILDLGTRTVFAHEALVRGIEGTGAATVLERVDASNRYSFDQACRVKAIEMAAHLSLPQDGARLSINFMPNAVYEPAACIRLTLATAKRTGFPLDRIIFEFTEGEELDTPHVQKIVSTYQEMGFMTAIDDFGAGYAGLTLLAEFQPDLVKIDMKLVRGIDTDRKKRAIIKGILVACTDMGVAVLAEGIETRQEHETLCDLGVLLQQGYLFARPTFEALAQPDWPIPPAGKPVSLLSRPSDLQVASQ